MTYTIEMHPELPALIGIWQTDFVFARDVRDYAVAMQQALNQQETPVYYVLDLRVWNDMPFDELMQAASIAAGGEDSNFHHRMSLANLVVTRDPAVKASLEGLRSDAFGNANTLIFNALEDAFNYIKNQL